MNQEAFKVMVIIGEIWWANHATAREEFFPRGQISFSRDHTLKERNLHPEQTVTHWSGYK